MKRLGANEAALRRLIESGITVESVSEDLYCVGSTDVGGALWDDLTTRGFDRCGIRESGRIVGYTERPDGAEGGDVRPMSVDQLVADTTPLWQTMPRLAEARWLFVLTPGGPNGIVTVADLAKHPARLLMFGVISLLEMTILGVIRREHPDDGWRKLLNRRRIEKAEQILGKRREKGQEIDLADCLQWCDKATIGARTEQVRERWGFRNRRECERYLKAGQDLRDLLAHAQHPAPDAGWCRVVEWLREADRLVRVNLRFLDGHVAETENAD